MGAFDILGNGYPGAGAGAPSSGGFDILAPGVGPRSAAPGGGQGSPVFNTVPLGGQPGGQPVSGLLAGMMNLPTTGGAVPGAAYLAQPRGQGQAPGQAPGQAQPYGGSPLLAGILGLPAGGQLAQLGQPAQQPSNGLALGVGNGVRSFLDGIMGAGR